MATQSIPLTYKGHPLRRKDSLIYYGSMAEKYIIMLQVLDQKKDQDLDMATRVSVQLQLTDPDLKSRDRVVKKTEKDSCTPPWTWHPSGWTGLCPANKFPSTYDQNGGILPMITPAKLLRTTLLTVAVSAVCMIGAPPPAVWAPSTPTPFAFATRPTPPPPSWPPLPRVTPLSSWRRRQRLVQGGLQHRGRLYVRRVSDGLRSGRCDHRLRPGSGRRLHPERAQRAWHHLQQGDHPQRWRGGLHRGH